MTPQPKPAAAGGMKRMPSVKDSNYGDPELETVEARIPTDWGVLFVGVLTLRFKIAQKPYIIRSLGPRIVKYESLEPQGYTKSPSIWCLYLGS